MTEKEFIEQLAEILSERLPRKQEELGPILRQLVEIIFTDLENATKHNPLEHHLVVLRHMLEIAAAENFTATEVKRAAALSLLHDISPVEIITKGQVEELRSKDPEAAEALELRRQQNRILHMRQGSALAHERLLDLNERSGQVVFDAEDIEAVCETISIHDNPSLDIPIPQENWLAVAFRESDRLWMITPEGIDAALLRKGRNVADQEERRRQLQHNLKRFREERHLYNTGPGEGPFWDSETFFRTQKGYEIYRSLAKPEPG